MVIQHKGVDFQSKSHLVDEITERMTTASVNRSVSRNKQTPHLRQIMERKAGDNQSLYRGASRNLVATPNGASISALRGNINQSLVNRRTLSIGGARSYTSKALSKVTSKAMLSNQTTRKESSIGGKFSHLNQLNLDKIATTRSGAFTTMSIKESDNNSIMQTPNQKGNRSKIVDNFIQNTVDQLRERASQGVIVNNQSRKDFINSKKLAYKARSNVMRGRSTQMSIRSNASSKNEMVSPKSDHMSSRTPINRESENFFAFKLKIEPGAATPTRAQSTFGKTDPESLQI